MKKNVRFLSMALISLFAAALIVSCEKDTNEDLDLILKAKKSTVMSIQSVDNVASTPVSLDQLVTPYIIPGANKGGNRTCDEVAAAFNTTFDLCGDKINYGDYLTEDEFENAFPAGLNVEVNGIYISFDAAGCIEIEGKFYKVGAVIVKGANEANVYYYEGGALSDRGLAAPGNQAMVSNLTFCFIECDEPIIVAVKGLYFFGAVGDWSTYTWTASVGTQYPFTVPPCNNIGVNVLTGDVVNFSLHPPYNFDPLNYIGEVSIVKDIDGWLVSVDLDEGLTLDETFVYIGPLSGLTCEYTQAPWVTNDDNGNSVSFTIPY